MMTPALRLVDVIVALFPDRREKISQAVTEFYVAREQRMGEHLVQLGLLTTEELQLAVLTQKAELGKLSKADVVELAHIQAAVHARFMASFEDVILFATACHAKGRG